ncbi:MAG: hypothetical protein JWO75_2829 [Actinomycetia bacterium]|nr:hypothetical protein [Actinomycetes bacterium]
MVPALISAGKRTGQSMESFSPASLERRSVTSRSCTGEENARSTETARNHSLNRPGRSPGKQNRDLPAQLRPNHGCRYRAEHGPGEVLRGRVAGWFWGCGDADRQPAPLPVGGALRGRPGSGRRPGFGESGGEDTSVTPPVIRRGARPALPISAAVRSGAVGSAGPPFRGYPALSVSALAWSPAGLAGGVWAPARSARLTRMAVIVMMRAASMIPADTSNPRPKPTDSAWS